MWVLLCGFSYVGSPFLRQSKNMHVRWTGKSRLNWGGGVWLQVQISTWLRERVTCWGVPYLYHIEIETPADPRDPECMDCPDTIFWLLMHYQYYSFVYQPIPMSIWYSQAIDGTYFIIGLDLVLSVLDNLQILDEESCRIWYLNFWLILAWYQNSTEAALLSAEWSEYWKWMNVYGFERNLGFIKQKLDIN